MSKSIEIQIRGKGKWRRQDRNYIRTGKSKMVECSGRIYRDPLVPQLHAMDMFATKRIC